MSAHRPPPVGAVWFGRFGDSALADEVVLTVKQLEPTAWIEIHSHGGPQVGDWLIDLLRQQGVEPRTWREFLTEVEPPWRAAALEALARAATARTGAILLDQANGAFHEAIMQVRHAWNAGQIDSMSRRVAELLQFAPVGLHLIDPWRVVIAGAPNAGKSSLVNALAGFQRSVVAPVPGTTRDVVSTRLAIDGWPVELFDTAGIREEVAGLERAGIDAARAAVENAELCLWLVDGASDDQVWPPADSDATIVAVNKCDLPSNPLAVRTPDLRISAQTGQGIPELLAGISRKLVPIQPPPGAGVPYLASQVAALRNLLEALKSGDLAGVIQGLTELEI
jgi:tRNA modification GTPase